jgi:hypothetical protein
MVLHQNTLGPLGVKGGFKLLPLGREDLGQGRSLLKYTNYGICISLERKVGLLEVSLDFH